MKFEITGKVWKKEDELKLLKSGLAALDRKIQLELAPPTPEVAEKENDGQRVGPEEAEDVRNRKLQYPEDTLPHIRSQGNEPNPLNRANRIMSSHSDVRFKDGICAPKIKM